MSPAPLGSGCVPWEPLHVVRKIVKCTGTDHNESCASVIHSIYTVISTNESFVYRRRKDFRKLAKIEQSFSEDGIVPSPHGSKRQKEMFQMIELADPEAAKVMLACNTYHA